ALLGERERLLFAFAARRLDGVLVRDPRRRRAPDVLVTVAEVRQRARRGIEPRALRELRARFGELLLVRQIERCAKEDLRPRLLVLRERGRRDEQAGHGQAARRTPPESPAFSHATKVPSRVRIEQKSPGWGRGPNPHVTSALAAVRRGLRRRSSSGRRGRR